MSGKVHAVLGLVSLLAAGCATQTPQGAAPPDPPAASAPADEAERAEAIEVWKQFMQDHPDLAEHQRCVLKVALFGDVANWDELSNRATDRCVPTSRWRYFGRNQAGVSFYYDPETIALRKGEQVDLWLRTDSPSFDDEGTDVSAKLRLVADCDKRQFFFVDALIGESNGAVRALHPPTEWKSAAPDSVMGDIVGAACRYRSIALARSTDAPAPSPHGTDSPATSVRAPTQEEIDRALKTYLRKRFSF
jgi:hypothetical protein